MRNIESSINGNVVHVVGEFDPFINAADLTIFYATVYEQARAVVYQRIEEISNLRSHPLEVVVIYEHKPPKGKGHQFLVPGNTVWTGMIDTSQPDRLTLRHRGASIHVTRGTITLEGPKEHARRRYVKSWTLNEGEPEIIWNLVLETKDIFTEPHSIPDSPNELLMQMRRWGYLIHTDNPRSPPHDRMPGVWHVIVGFMTTVPRLPTYLHAELSNDHIAQAIVAYDKLHHFINAGPPEGSVREPAKFPPEGVSAEDEVLLRCVVDLLLAAGTYNILFDEMVNKTQWTMCSSPKDPDGIIQRRLTELLTEPLGR